MKDWVSILDRALDEDRLSLEEGLLLYERAPLSELMLAAHELRMRKHPERVVTWIIDRNVNYTNVCNANCLFCNFFRPPRHPEGYVLDDETLYQKIEQTIALGGDQLLLQGGHNPELGIEYYEMLFRKIKSRFPDLKLHALGPPEVIHITKVSRISIEEALQRLIAAGLDSLPGAGAEILSDRVRRLIARGKCSTAEWLQVMRTAHRLGLLTTATMMFGHVESVVERLQHLLLIRDLQDEKPEGAIGFIAFIPWPYQDVGTRLSRVLGVRNQVTAAEYLRVLAISRLMLPNIPNIQASWLTVGPEVAQLALYGGANDLGSIMIEENVVSAAGASYRMDAEAIQRCILEAGFTPRLRDQRYRYRPAPPGVPILDGTAPPQSPLAFGSAVQEA
ncbi:MAG: dehypoxanthine futalosine cyclase [Bacteroidetes bacterium]|nr:dehypoxanthine futalosine cyclase [Bacteroidota bacterium]MCX7905930.1 dehypoxanthine futalosine cyclase [Bacteroidota bacterium]MDW8138103.1 cyclic dehypoxanthinyl futalosine synthase [Bacteroidota bacterium]